MYDAVADINDIHTSAGKSSGFAGWQVSGSVLRCAAAAGALELLVSSPVQQLHAAMNNPSEGCAQLSAPPCTACSIDSLLPVQARPCPVCRHAAYMRQAGHQCGAEALSSPVQVQLGAHSPRIQVQEAVVAGLRLVVDPSLDYPTSLGLLRELRQVGLLSGKSSLLSALKHIGPCALIWCPAPGGPPQPGRPHCWGACSASCARSGALQPVHILVAIMHALT